MFCELSQSLRMGMKIKQKKTVVFVPFRLCGNCRFGFNFVMFSCFFLQLCVASVHCRHRRSLGCLNYQKK
jgi:hypothetical protein